VNERELLQAARPYVEARSHARKKFPIRPIILHAGRNCTLARELDGVHGGDPTMVSCAYLRRQAALCLRLAAAVDDQNVVAALMVMADDFSRKADEVDPSLNLRHCDQTTLGPRGPGSASLSEMPQAVSKPYRVLGHNG
jgi:hypothetical protein